MLLPNAARAFIDLRKLADYCLSPFHPVGRHKAVVFQSALGLGQADAEALRDMILQQVGSHEALPALKDEHGERYQVDVPISTAKGSAIVRTAWMIRAGEDFPRLTTCYVLGS